MVNAMVEINNYSIQLGKFKLNQINLNISEKEIFAVLGRTGSGKTVLLESVAGFYRKFSGNPRHRCTAGKAKYRICLSGLWFVSPYDCF